LADKPIHFCRLQKLPSNFVIRTQLFYSWIFQNTSSPSPSKTIFALSYSRTFINKTYSSSHSFFSIKYDNLRSNHEHVASRLTLMLLSCDAYGLRKPDTTEKKSSTNIKNDDVISLLLSGPILASVFVMKMLHIFSNAQEYWVSYCKSNSFMSW
jgi:hypothetical protein